jgi:hypothetical protein
MAQKPLTPEEYKSQFEKKLRAEQEVRDRLKAEPRGPIPILLAYTAEQLTKVEFAPREPLLYRGDQVFFHSSQIIEVFATRGEGKTWFMLTLAVLMAYGKSGMGFTSRKPTRVLYIDGEMARQDIVDRVRLIAETLGIDLRRQDDLLSGNLVIIAADWQDDPLPRVDSIECQTALAAFIDQAAVVFIDNRSCLMDPEGEKDPAAWQPAGDFLLSLRRRGLTVFLAHHANRQGGARGIGKPEDAMDMIIRLQRPADRSEAGAVFQVSVQPEDGGKARGLWGAAAVPFTVELTPDGWQVQTEEEESGNKVIEERLRTHLTQLAALGDDQLPTSMTSAVNNVSGDKSDKIAAFHAMFSRGEIVRDGKRFRLAASREPVGGDGEPQAVEKEGRDAPF